MDHPRFGTAVREQFTLDPEDVFLNHGSFGATPLSVQTAQSNLRARMEARPVVFLLAELPDALRSSAQRLGQRLGAQGQDVVFVENATTAVNTVLHSLDLKPGDEVVATSHVYPGVQMAIERVCERYGACFRPLPIPFPMNDPDAIVVELERILSDRTTIAVLDHITSATALTLPIRQLTRSCQARGVPVLIDGAHVPGQLPLNLEDLDADWYTGNCHKWMFAPKGCAFLWRNPKNSRPLPPLVASLHDRVGFPTAFDWPGTRDPTAWLALDAALAFIDGHGAANIRQYNNSLADTAANLLSEAWDSPLPCAATHRASMATLLVPGEIPGTLEEALNLNLRIRKNHRIEVPIFPVPSNGPSGIPRCGVRISAQIYNTLQQYERLADAVLEETS